jgi:hypothetical protein
LYLVRDVVSALVETETELGMTPTDLEWSQVFVTVSVLLSPVSCGFSWTFWIDTHTLLTHYRVPFFYRKPFSHTMRIIDTRIRIVSWRTVRRLILVIS